MKTKTQLYHRNNRDGIALVIVLGLLAVLTLLAVAFSIAMRIEYMAARNNANAVRAQELVHIGIVRSMLHVDKTMKGICYPKWTNEPAHRLDALASTNGTDYMTNLITGEAARMLACLPTSLSNDAYAAQTYSRWERIVSTNNGVVTTNGRIAYVVVNMSGMIDPNFACGQERVDSRDINETDPSGLLITTAYSFITQRTAHRRYETPMELMALNTAVNRPNEGFFPYSYDVNRDKFFMNYLCPAAFPYTAMALGNTSRAIMDVSTMGSRAATNILKNKFDINSIRNYQGYYRPWDLNGYLSDGQFMNNYYTPLYNILGAHRLSPRAYYASGSSPHWMMERPDDGAWNIINWIDPDRIPQGGDNLPWTHTEGGEPMPLMNEIALLQSANSNPGAGSNEYVFAVELWYPFVPAVIQPSDNFRLWIGIYNKTHNELAGVDENNIMGSAWKSSETPIDYMAYGVGLDKEFKVITSEPFSFTNGTPIGTGGNRVAFLARLLKGDLNAAGVMVWNPVDEAMGYKPGTTEADYKRRLKEFNSECGYSVTDPRANGQVKYWWTSGEAGRNIGGYGPYATNLCTLGNTNRQLFTAVGGIACVTDPWARKGSGLPLVCRNGPMVNIGELGHIFRSNLDDEDNQGDFWWRTIDLMHYDEGGALLDWMTVRYWTNEPGSVAEGSRLYDWSARRAGVPNYGLFAINSKQTNAIRGIFENLMIGYTNELSANTYKLDDAYVKDLATLIISNSSSYGPGFISFRSMWQATAPSVNPDDSGGPLAKKFREAAKNAVGAPVGGLKGDIFLEDPFRRICEMITFRQNIFGVIITAQAFGGDGETVVGEKRALVTIYRDAYTGQYFIRSLKWLGNSGG